MMVCIIQKLGGGGRTRKEVNVILSYIAGLVLNFSLSIFSEEKGN